MHRQFKRRALLLASCSLAFTGEPTLAHAETGASDSSVASDIIVTARKTSETLIDTPMSVSVRSAAELEAPRLRDFADLAADFPNVAMSGGIAGSLQGQIAIRGISSLVRNIGLESGVGIYVDDVYIGRPDSYNMDLLDIQQAELLRGPQGTVYGKNTIAGLFNITSKAPSDTPTASARVDIGNYGLVRTQASLSGPLYGDTLKGSIALGYVHRDGYDKNLSGGPNADNADTFSWRGTLAYQASDALSLTLRTDGLHDRSIPGFYSATQIGQPGFVLIPELPPHQINNNRPNHLARDSAGGSLTADLSLGSSTLKSITAYRFSHSRASLDDDQQQIDLLSADLFGDRTKVWSQELRLNGRLGDRATYVTGLYFFDQRENTDRTLAIGNDFGHGVIGNPALTTIGSVSTRSYAAYGNVDWRITDALMLSAGARYTLEQKDVHFTQDDVNGVFQYFGLPTIVFAGHSVNRDLSPTVSLRYAIAPKVNVYARVARGFKSAAYNVDLTPSIAGLTARPENATTYEAGLRASFKPAQATVLLSGFHTSYDNLQVAQITGGATALSNAGHATINGFEAELTLHPLTNLKLAGSLGYADAHYDRFDNCAIPQSEGGGAMNCAGKRLAGAPEFTSQGSVEYGIALPVGRLSGTFTADHQSSVYYEPTNSDRFRGRARTVFDAAVTLDQRRWSVSVWGKNLTNQVYETYMDDRTTVGVLRTIAYGAPRTFGITLAASY